MPTDLKLADYIRRSPTFRSRASFFATSRRCWPIRRRFAGRWSIWPTRSAAAKIDVVAAAEARGFILAAPVALELNAALVPIRKPGKLPFNTESLSYDLEYGSDTLEIHADAIKPGAKVLVVDDLLATGGTVEACCRLGRESRRCGGRLLVPDRAPECKGAHRIAKYQTVSLVKY